MAKKDHDQRGANGTSKVARPSVQLFDIDRANLTNESLFADAEPMVTEMWPDQNYK